MSDRVKHAYVYHNHTKEKRQKSSEYKNVPRHTPTWSLVQRTQEFIHRGGAQRRRRRAIRRPGAGAGAGAGAAAAVVDPDA